MATTTLHVWVVEMNPQLQLGKADTMMHRALKLRALKSRRTKQKQVNVALNNISAAANIMGETERKSIKQLPSRLLQKFCHFVYTGEAVARNLSLLKAKVSRTLSIARVSNVEII